MIGRRHLGLLLIGLPLTFRGEAQSRPEPGPPAQSALSVSAAASGPVPVARRVSAAKQTTV